MTYPITPSKFSNNPYDPAWAARDFFISIDGDREYPKHHCKTTFMRSLPFAGRFRNAVDVGCRDGEYARYLQQHYQHTYCFDPRERWRFPHNVDLAKATHFECALGDEVTDIVMYGGTHKVRDLTPMTVRCLTLDSFEFQDVDYLKVDVEGFEKKVLIGGARTIERCRPLIVIEQNTAALPGAERYDARAWLEERGYSVKATCARGWDYIMAAD